MLVSGVLKTIATVYAVQMDVWNSYSSHIHNLQLCEFLINYTVVRYVSITSKNYLLQLFWPIMGMYLGSAHLIE